MPGPFSAATRFRTDSHEALTSESASRRAVGPMQRKSSVSSSPGCSDAVTKKSRQSVVSRIEACSVTRSVERGAAATGEYERIWVYQE